MKKWDAFVYGDVNVDIVIPNVEQFPKPGQEDVVDRMDTFVGGGAALFTLGLGRLGLNPVFQGSVGNDCYGDFIRKEFQCNNVDTSLIKTSEINKTGISLSFTNEKDRSFLTYRGTNAEIDLSQADMNQIELSRHIHITQYGGKKNHKQYLELLKKIKKSATVTVSMDVGWDETGEWYEGIYKLFPYIDILFMNETEAIHYGRKTDAREAAMSFAKECRIVVLKLGSKGSAAFSEHYMYEENPCKVTAVDTTGAGDSFNAGFVFGFLKEKTIQECLQMGNVCGALSVTAYGGNTAFPTEKELLLFLAEQQTKISCVEERQGD